MRGERDPFQTFAPTSVPSHSQEAIDKQKEKEQRKSKLKSLKGLQQDAQKRSKQFEKKVSCVLQKDKHLLSLNVRHLSECIPLHVLSCRHLL